MSWWCFFWRHFTSSRLIRVQEFKSSIFQDGKDLSKVGWWHESRLPFALIPGLDIGLEIKKRKRRNYYEKRKMDVDWREWMLSDATKRRERDLHDGTAHEKERERKRKWEKDDTSFAKEDKFMMRHSGGGIQVPQKIGVPFFREDDSPSWDVNKHAHFLFHLEMR